MFCYLDIAFVFKTWYSILSGCSLHVTEEDRRELAKRLAIVSAHLAKAESRAEFNRTLSNTSKRGMELGGMEISKEIQVIIEAHFFKVWQSDSLEARSILIARAITRSGLLQGVYTVILLLSTISGCNLSHASRQSV